MSVLIVLIPPRPRLAPRPTGDGTPAPRSDEFDYLLSADGETLSAQGHAAPARLPQADSVIAVLGDADVAWHRVVLPRAPAARMRAALQGVLEEALLDEDSAVHMALPPQPAPGQLNWVAVVHRPWLAGELSRLERGGRSVDRVVPSSVPGVGAEGHFFVSAGATADNPTLHLSYADSDGHCVLRLTGSLPRQRFQRAADKAVRWTAAPAAAAAAEGWLGRPVTVIDDAMRALQATQSVWNLRQFEFAVRHRGMRALREGRRQFFGPAWRPVRIGLVGVVALHLVGLNVWAYQQRQALADKRQAMVALLKSTHPGVRAVLDAPLQMARETDALRAAAGRPGESDLESLLAAAASAWPEEAGPLQGLRFENARLSLPAPGWAPASVEAFRARLQPGGWVVEATDGQLTLSRAVGRGECP